MQRLGPYRIIRTVALGGMGEVFLATLERSGGFEKRVALKCVLPRLMADPHFVELFEREARLAAALSHRHIVQIFDFGRDQGRSWLAMEYVHGVDLKAVLDSRGATDLPLSVAIEIGIACARGLDYAHRARDPRGRPLHLVHRDVSPQNVLLSFEGDVKLADFGLAHAAARDPHEGGLQGKFAYMSPEQVAGRPLDGRSDQFALGVVLYEMVSGQRAFFAEDGVEQILDRVRQASPLAPLSAAAPDLPAPLRAVIERTLKPDRTDRFPDAGALAEALSAAATASGLRPGEPPLGPWLKTCFPERSRPPLPAVEHTVGPRSMSGQVEITAVAGQPIATPVEHTVDASAPVGLRIDPLAATPSGLGPDREGDPSSPGASSRHTAVLTVPAGDGSIPASPSTAATPAPTGPIHRADSAPAAETNRWPVVVLALLLLSGGGLWWASVDAPSEAPRDAAAMAQDARIADAQPAERSPLDAAPADGPLDGESDAAQPDARPSDAARRAHDSRPMPDSRPNRPAPPIRPRRDARMRAVDAGRPAPIRDMAATAATPDTSAPEPDAAPERAASAGPRVRLFSPGARVTGPASPDGWWTVPPTGLLLRVVDGSGPPVVLRIKARSGRFEAAVDARPWGQVLLGDRDLGATPAAAVPLEAGRQTLRVVGPDQRETVIRIEASRD